MAEQLLGEFPQDIERLELISSSGGRFEVVADDALVYSKKATGRHAEYAEVADAIRALLT